MSSPTAGSPTNGNAAPAGAPRKYRLVLVATDTPQQCEAANLLGWLAQGVETVSNCVVVSDSATIAVELSAPLADATAAGEQILNAAQAAADGMSKLEEERQAIAVVYCPTPMVAYTLLNEEPAGPSVATLLVVNSSEAIPPAPATIASATPVKGKGAAAKADPKKAPPKGKAPTPVVATEEAEDRDAFAVELAILCEGDDDDEAPVDIAVSETPGPGDAPRPDSTPTAAAAAEAANAAAAAQPSAADKLPADVQKQALFAAMELAVVDVTPGEWPRCLRDDIVVAVTAAADTTGHYDAWVAGQSVHAVPVLEADKRSQQPAERGPWGQYEQQRSHTSSQAVVPRSAKAAGGPMTPKHAAASQPTSPSSPAQPRAAHSVQPSSQLMAPGGHVASSGAGVVASVIDQVNRERTSVAPTRNIVRVEKRHVPRSTIEKDASNDSEETPAAEESTTKDPAPAAEKEDAPDAAEAAPEEPVSAFVTIEVPVGPVMQVPAESNAAETSSFDDVWSVVSATCSWGGQLSVPAADPIPIAPAAAGDAMPERPSTNRRSKLFDSDNALAAASTDSLRAPSPAMSASNGGGSGIIERGRPAQAVAVALASTFGRDMVETRTHAQRAARYWERAAEAERKTRDFDARGEGAAVRLLRAAKARGGSAAMQGPPADSANASPGGTVTFQAEHTGSFADTRGEALDRTAASKDRAQVRRIASETVTKYESQFALLQARAQSVLDNIRRAAAAAAEDDAPRMLQSAGFAGSITRRSEMFSTTIVREDSPVSGRSSPVSRKATRQSNTRADTSQSNRIRAKPAGEGAVPVANLTAHDFIFTQALSAADANRIVADHEAAVEGAYRSEYVALEPDSVVKNLVQSATAATDAAKTGGQPGGPRSKQMMPRPPGDRAPDSRPSSSGSVLKVSNDGNPASATPIGMVCSAPVNPPDGFRASTTTMLYGGAPPPTAFALLRRDAVDQPEVSPLQRWASRWLEDQAPRPWAASETARVASQEQLAWYRADGSVIVASGASTNRERRITTRVADVVASLSVNATDKTPEDGDKDCNNDARAESAFTATFADGTVLHIKNSRRPPADAAAGTDLHFAVPQAFMSTRQGTTVSLTPGVAQSTVTLKRQDALDGCLSMLTSDGTVVRVHVQETGRDVDRATGRVTRHLTSAETRNAAVREVLEPSGQVCVVVKSADATTFLVTRPEGERVGKVVRAAPADGATSEKASQAWRHFSSIKVRDAHDVEGRRTVWSRADGCYVVARDDGLGTVAVFADGTRISCDQSRDDTVPRVQVESPVPAGCAAMPIVAVDRDGFLVVYAPDGADTLRERVNRFGRSELHLSRRGGTSVSLDLDTNVTQLRPWTLPALLGHDPETVATSKGMKRELEALLLGVHVFDLDDGCYRHLDAGLQELCVALTTTALADREKPQRCGEGLVQPFRALGQGISADGSSFLRAVAERDLDTEAALLQIAGQKKVLPPRMASRQTISQASNAASSTAAGPASVSTRSASPPLPTDVVSRAQQRLRLLAAPIVAHFDLLEYNTAKARDAARRAAEKSGSVHNAVPSQCQRRPLLFVYMDDGTVQRLLTGADLAPLLRHAVGTSAVTLSRAVIGGEPGVQQISYVLDAAKDPSDPTLRLARRGLVEATKSAVIKSQSTDPSEAPPAQSFAAAGGDGAQVVRDLDALIPRGMLPPSHVVTAQRESKAEANPPILLSFTRFAPIAPPVRNLIVADAVAEADASHASSLYSAALEVPDYRTPEERGAGDAVAQRNADSLARYRASLEAARAAEAEANNDAGDDIAADDAAEVDEEQYDDASARRTRPPPLGTAGFASTAAASNPIKATPAQLDFGDLPRGFAYQMMLTLENTTSGPVTFTAKRVASKLAPGVIKHPVEVQAGRGVIPAQGKTSIGIVVSASFVDPGNVSGTITITSNASRQALMVKVTASLLDDVSVPQHVDPKVLVDRLPTSIKLLGVAR